MALGGLVASGILLAHDDGGWRTGDGTSSGLLRSLCQPASLPSASCDEVVGSRWGSFDITIGARRWEVPLSFVGFAYFLTMAVWFVFIGTRSSGHRLERDAPMCLGLCGVAASVVLIAVMAVEIGSWCPLCVIAHAANVGMVALLLVRLRSSPGQARPSPWTRTESGGPTHGRFAWLAVMTSACAVTGSWMVYETTVELRRQWRGAHGLRQAIEEIQEDEAIVLHRFLAEPVSELPAINEDTNGPEPRLVIYLDRNSRASNCFESVWRERFAVLAERDRRTAYLHAARVEERARAASLGLEEAPAARLGGRRVPDLCLRSETFWRLIGRSPELIDGTVDPIALGPVHGAPRDNRSKVRQP